MQEHGSMHSSDIYKSTYSVPDLDELRLIIRQMRSNAAPGPDGMNAAFYKSAWSWLKQDIHKMMTDFYAHAYIPTEINKTYITLIPKNNELTAP
jgi:hypothetical protein